MGDRTTSLPPPGVGMASATLGETNHNMCDSGLWGTPKRLHFSILDHADDPKSRSRTQRRTQSYTSVHGQQKQANPLHRNIFPQSVSRRNTWLLIFSFSVRGLSSRCTFPHEHLRLQEDTLTSGSCTAAHNRAQAPPPQGPGSIANLKAYSSDMGLGAEGKLGIKGDELRIPRHLGRLPSRRRELQASKG